MEITEVRVKLTEDNDDRLQGFCSITFDDCFVVRDLKIIDGTNGPFVAMPSRKLTSHCPQCRAKNHLRAAHCNQCGLRLKDDRALRDQEGRAKLYADIAHPINSSCREMIQNKVIEEFRAEKDRARQPGYIPSYNDDYVEAELPATNTSTHIRTDPAAGKPSPAGQAKDTTAGQAKETTAGEPRTPHQKSSTRRPARPKQSGFGEGIL